jgi:hypothetical protein
MVRLVVAKARRRARDAESPRENSDQAPLYKSGMPFHEWEKRVVDEIRSRDFVAFGLHDCYADLWLPHYATFLEKITRLGTLKTLDTVADETILASAM